MQSTALNGVQCKRGGQLASGQKATLSLHSKVRRHLFKQEKKMIVMECSVNNVALVAMLTSTTAQGEAYWCRPFLHGSFVVHAFVSVESRCVMCCCCCWAYLLIIVVSFGTIFCVDFFV